MRLKCWKCKRPITPSRRIFHFYRHKGERLKSVSLDCRDCSNADMQISRHRKKEGITDFDDPRYNIRFPYRGWGKKLDACNGRCPRCKRKAQLTIDHIKPLSKGGKLHIRNLQPLCKSCNSSKLNRLEKPNKISVKRY